MSPAVLANDVSSTEGPRQGRPPFDWFLTIPLIATALLVVAGGADFMFDPPGLVDAYGMVGRIWHYADHNPLFEAYKNSRLPWILPGVVAHRLFDVVTASYILHTTVLVGSSLAIYFVLRDTLRDRVTAAVVSTAWGSYTWIHGVGGWNYHVYAATAYYLWSLWMLVRSTRATRPHRTLVAGGALLICAVHTHIVFAGFVPIAALLCLPGPGGILRGGWRRAAATSTWAAAGAVGATAVLGAIDVAAGGRWLFFMPQVEFTLDLARGGNRWLVAPEAWMGQARHLVIPCLTVAGGACWLVGTLVRPRGRREELDFARILVVQGLLAFALMAYLQFVAGQDAFDYPYVTVPLYGPCFLLLGALLWAGTRPSSRFDLPAAALAAAVMVAPLLLLLPSWLPQHIPVITRTLYLPEAPAVVAPLVVGLAGLCLGVVPGWSRIAVVTLAYALLNAWLAAAPGSYGMRTPGINRDLFVAFRSLDRFTAEIDPSLFAIRYWSEPAVIQGPRGPVRMDDVLNSFVSLRRRSLVTAAYDRPDSRVHELTTADLYSSSCIGVLSTVAGHEASVDRTVQRFDALGVALRPAGHHQAESGAIALALTVLTSRPANDPRPGLLPCPPSP